MVIIGCNKEQEIAIKHKDGPMMVLAGPGSGKTFVITNRLKNLIEVSGVPPEEILVITFTKASALEMQGRFEKLMDEKYYPVTFGTFHAIYFHILKETYNLTFSNIITEKEKREYLKMVLSAFEKEQIDGDYTEEILSCISKIKNDGSLPSDLDISFTSRDTFTKIYNEYGSMLKEYKKLDFDDMVLHCYQLFKAKPDILKKWQVVYKYILIDEFQDINPMQYEVIKMLAQPENNLFIVGDDDQSIYGFRGSEPGIMLSFHKDYPDVKTVLLNKNYRSSKRIVDAASYFIGHNQKRFKKNLESVNEVGSEIQVLEFNTKDEEYEYILNLIKTLKRKCLYKDIALIFRTNNLARNLTTIFSINEIPFKFKEKPRNILEHYAVKDILAYLEYAYGEKTRAGLFKIINKPVRYIKREYFENKDSTLEDALKVPGLPDYAKINIKKLVYDLNFIKDYSMFAAINFIRKKIGYEEYAVKNITGGQEKVNELIEAMDLLAEISKKAHGYKGLLELLDKYQEDMDKAAASTDEDADAVTFITMHGSKGLEYKHVILPEVNEGNVPFKKATTFEAIEEERRVFYVAMTRAKENLFITYLKKGNDNRFPKSRFLSELS